MRSHSPTAGSEPPRAARERRQPSAQRWHYDKGSNRFSTASEPRHAANRQRDVASEQGDNVHVQPSGENFRPRPATLQPDKSQWQNRITDAQESNGSRL